MKNFPSFLLVITILVFASLACGSVEVGIVSPTTESKPINVVDIQESTPEVNNTPEENPHPTAEAANEPLTTVSQPETKPGVPDEVTLGPLFFGTPDTGLAVIQDQTVRIADSPVEFGLLWDYSPISGRLAYASQFFYGSQPLGNFVPNYSISDLWIYDYESGQSELWMSDYVNRAVWAPDGERITASIFNPASNQLDLVLVSGPDQVELVATCASAYFSWSPNGDQLAYAVSADMVTGMPTECVGFFVVTGMQSGDYQVERLLGESPEAFSSNSPGAQPYWTLEQDALISPNPPFWVVPVDGSPPFTPQFFDGVSGTSFPWTDFSLWSVEHRQLITHAWGGLSGMGGVWVFEFSEDFRTIENYYKVGGPASEGNSDITLVSWWQNGESILVADGDMPEPKPWINDFWAPPKVWSLIDQIWTELEYQQ